MELGNDKKIDELLELERDNNHILHKMRRSMIWGNVFTLFYWAIILGGIGASYYFLQPYITKYWGVYQNMMQTLENIEKTGQSFSNDLGGLLEKVR